MQATVDNLCRTGQACRRAADKISGDQQSYQRPADAIAIERGATQSRTHWGRRFTRPDRVDFVIAVCIPAERPSGHRIGLRHRDLELAVSRASPPRHRPGRLIPRTRYNGPLPRLDMLDMLARRAQLGDMSKCTQLKGFLILLARPRARALGQGPQERKRVYRTRRAKHGIGRFSIWILVSFAQ
jgi:hypothetical protein